MCHTLNSTLLGVLGVLGVLGLASVLGLAPGASVIFENPGPSNCFTT